MSTISLKKYPAGNYCAAELLRARRARTSVSQASLSTRIIRNTHSAGGLEMGHAGYVKLDNDANAVKLATQADPSLSCWVALVQTWDNIESKLEEIDVSFSTNNAVLITGRR